MNPNPHRHLPPSELRQLIRSGELNGPTAGLANGFAQANLMIVRRDLAYDFLLFCQRNPKPCPLLDVTDPGCSEPMRASPGADIRSDFRNTGSIATEFWSRKSAISPRSGKTTWWAS